MRGFSFVVLAAVAGIGLTVTAPKAEAQVGVAIGVAPECPYGYYDVAPYNCAPTGYYGAEAGSSSAASNAPASSGRRQAMKPSCAWKPSGAMGGGMNSIPMPKPMSLSIDHRSEKRRSRS